MTMAGGISVTPVCPSLGTYVCPNDVSSLSPILLIRILWNLVELFSTMMSSSSSIMVHIAPCFQLLWPFVYENSPFETMKSNMFNKIFMKLGHMVKYHDVFFKFHDSPYRTMLSVVVALCLWKFTIWNDVRSLSQICSIRILWNLVTWLSTMMSSSSSIMVHIAPCFQQLWPFVYENSPLETTSAL